MQRRRAKSLQERASLLRLPVATLVLDWHSWQLLRNISLYSQCQQFQDEGFFVDISESNFCMQLMSGEYPKVKKDEQFVWPWRGILINVPAEFKNRKYVGETENELKEQLSEFNPIEVNYLWTWKGRTGTAVIDFNKDWTGLRDAMAFESHFYPDHFDKMTWVERRNSASGMHGWVARSDDFFSRDPIGEFLRKDGDLKTIDDII